MKREVAARLAVRGIFVEYVRFQTGRKMTRDTAAVLSSGRAIRRFAADGLARFSRGVFDTPGTV